MAARIEHIDRNVGRWFGRERIVDDGSLRRIRCLRHLLRERCVVVHVAPHAHRIARLEETSSQPIAELPQHRAVVEYPDPATIRADDQVIVMDGEVADDRGGQVAHQRLPVIAVVERDVHAGLGTCEQEPASFGVRAHDVHERAAGHGGRQSRDDLCPRFPIVTRAVDVRVEVAAIVRVERDVRGARVEGGCLDRREHRAYTDRGARVRNVSP